MPGTAWGYSAGGNLSAADSLMARKRGGVDISSQILINPIMNLNSPDTDSYRDFGEGHLLTLEAMHWLIDRYVPRAEKRQNSYASPLLAGDLSNLPKALIATAEFDPLRQTQSDGDRNL